MEEDVVRHGLDNVAFFNEIPREAVPDLLAQRFAGPPAAHPQHKSHKVSGKFVSCPIAALPVTARLKDGTHLTAIIDEGGVGRASVERLADNPDKREAMVVRARAVARQLFSSSSATDQIIASWPARQALPDAQSSTAGMRGNSR